MRPAVEVFQIERIVVDLVNRASVECRGANFEFDHEHNAVDQKYHVRPFAHSRDRKLEKDLSPIKRRELIFQHMDLRQPRITLIFVKIESVCLTQLAQNLTFVSTQK